MDKQEKSLTIPIEFTPNLGATLYIIRRFLLEAILQYKHHLTGKMMDFGCGTQPYRSIFEVEEYIGVDIATDAVRERKRTINVFYDGKQLPFVDNTFDSVFSSEVFEHIFNLEEVLLEIHRVMKPDGKILITCPFVWNEHEVPNDYARYTQFALRHLFEKNGFEIIKIDKTGNFWLAMVQLLQLHTPLPRFLIIIPGFRKVIIILINLIGLGVNKIISPRYDLYLNTIVLAQKKDITP